MIDYESALALEIAPVEQTYTKRDTMLYALGLGIGGNPTDPKELAYVYEADLKVMPTMAVALAFTSFRDIPLGIDYARMVHGEQGLVVHKPFPPEATVIGRSRVRDVVDRGADKGALVYVDRDIHLKETGEHLATVKITVFCRGDGGVGGPVRPTPQVHAVPERPADIQATTPTLKQAALIYRLSGDYNPLHADPELATKVGFKAPILHGLATFGMMGRIVVEHVLDWNPDRLVEIDARFSAPVYPGETLVTELWRDGDIVSFRAKVAERDIVVINNGRARVTG